MMIKVLIADDHHLVRFGLRQTLEQEADMEIVGEGANGREILDLLSRGIKADVLLTDLSMPVMDGFELAKNITELYPDLQIILLTIQEEESYIQQAFQVGIKSYLFKTAHEEEVIFAVRQVARNQPYLCADLAERMIERITNSATDKMTADQIQFSKRELEILQLMAAGYTNEEAAEKLFTSKRTIEGHRIAMINRTGCRNSLALITYAMRNGLVN